MEGTIHRLFINSLCSIMLQLLRFIVPLGLQRWWPSWISDPCKNVNFVRNHPMAILVVCVQSIVVSQKKAFTHFQLNSLLHLIQVGFLIHLIRTKGAVVVVWQLDLQLPMQSVPITTKIVSSNTAQPQYYVIKFVGFLRVLWFLPPVNLTATI